MGFIRLAPPADGCALPVADIIRRLEDEFRVVLADPEEGYDHVTGMIAATLHLSRTWSGGPERLVALRAVQDEAVYVLFGDDSATLAGCCLMPRWDLSFGQLAAVGGPARPLVERAARALGYTVVEG